MPNYYVDEAVFALPERAFVDRTLHRLETPLPSGDPLVLEIRRLPLEEGKSLRELVDGEVASAKGKGNGFTVLEDAEVPIAGTPAILLRARLRARDVVYCQLQAHVAFDSMWIVFAVTGPNAERAACEETFDRIVHSLKWRSG